MLIQFSIANVAGNEIVRYELDISKFTEKMLDMNLISNFLQAMQIFSENIGTSIKEIIFSNVFLYIQTYGDFTIRVMLDEKPDIDMEAIFSETAKIMYDVLSRWNDVQVMPKSEVEKYFLPVLKPLIQYDAIEKIFQL